MKRYVKFCFPILTLLLLLFIFYNSMQQSYRFFRKEEAISQAVEQVVENVTQNEVTVNLAGKGVISKLAHVLEFGAFSLFFTLSVFIFHGVDHGAYYRIIYACLVVALADEQLQTLSSTRTDRVSDILIDLAACMMGYALAKGIFYLTQRRYKSGTCFLRT